MTLDELYEKLRKVQALAEEGGTEGERKAAEKAKQELQDRIDDHAYADDPEVEYRFSIHDPWKRRLFLAICRHHGVKPFRYKRQKRQSVMVRAPERFLDDILWPEYLEMSEILTEYLDDVTTSVIEDVLGQRDHDADIVSGTLPK